MIRRFNRYELKYLVHAKDYQPLVDDLLHFMKFDEHAGEDGYYRVTSLYYDSPDYQFYRSKIEGLKYRRKLRLRIYPRFEGDKVELGSVEIKQRINRTVQKRRIFLPYEEAQALCSGSFNRTDLDETDQAAASEILYLVRALRLKPACIVTYRRLALVGNRYESGMRVTFDALVSGRVVALDPQEKAPNQRLIPPNMYVLEVKVNERIPTWVVSLLARHECELQRISKYCLAVSKGLTHLRSGLENKENLYG